LGQIALNFLNFPLLRIPWPHAVYTAVSAVKNNIQHFITSGRFEATWNIYIYLKPQL